MPGKGGRPRKEIDRTQFEKLCSLQCTRDEICGWFDVTDKTLESWCKREYKLGFSAIYAKKREAGKISLRRAQFQLASKSAAMAIFLGKQYLGQTDAGTAQAATTETLQKLDEVLDKMTGGEE
ncbi:MAG: hypothetical protein IKH50_02530 [Oscillospiraceae bacterium]|nr:hypothetical protein [Oscillospiraceae bacterium]MBR6923396.1 hypothetical protein [Oscillospiraceae bacterium]